MRSLLITGFLAMVLPALAAQADDVALIYGDSGQSPLLQSGEDVPPETFAAPLAAAGFTVIEPSGRDAAAMRRAALQVQQMLDEGQVERLLIVVYGPFASTARDSWALSNDAVSASSITIGATGISLNALSDMAARAGRGAVMLAPGRVPDTLGSGLVPGLGDVTSVGSVTYFVGPAEALGRVLTGGLLNSDTSYAALAAALPGGVRMSGHVPEDAGFMGDAAPQGGDAMRQAGYWQAIRDIDTIDAYRLYLRAYPGAANRSLAQERIAFLQGAPVRMARAAEEGLRLSSAARRGIQRDLKTLGLYASGIDGRFGTGSRAAIAAWQRSRGHDETGYLTADQLEALRSDAETRAAQIAREQAEARQIQEREDRAYWEKTGKTGEEAGLRAYLARHPEGLFAPDARASLAAIEDVRDDAEAAGDERRLWQVARAADRPEDYVEYLNNYPDGRYAAQARERLEALEAAPEEERQDEAGPEPDED